MNGHIAKSRRGGGGLAAGGGAGYSGMEGRVCGFGIDGRRRAAIVITKQKSGGLFAAFPHIEGAIEAIE